MKSTLKYLFNAKFNDGTIFNQTPEDKSTLEPETRPAFYDVIETAKTKRLIEFTLTDTTFDRVYSVNLSDGHFEVNGIPFWMHSVENTDIDPMTSVSEVILSNFRLVYYRNNRQNIKVTAKSDGKFWKFLDSDTIDHTVVYHFGWQANDMKGRNYQEIMQLS